MHNEYIPMANRHDGILCKSQTTSPPGSSGENNDRKATAHAYDRRSPLAVDLSPSSPSAQIPRQNQRLVQGIWHVAVHVPKLTALDSGGCTRPGYKMPLSSITSCNSSRQPVFMHTIPTAQKICNHGDLMAIQ